MAQLVKCLIAQKLPWHNFMGEWFYCLKYYLVVPHTVPTF